MRDHQEMRFALARVRDRLGLLSESAETATEQMRGPPNKKQPSYNMCSLLAQNQMKLFRLVNPPPRAACSGRNLNPMPSD